MLIIKNSQMMAFSDYLQEAFISNALIILQNEFPEIMVRIKKPELIVMVRKGIQKAADYGVIERRDVLVYLRCMILYGAEFDNDPTYLRLTKILKTRNLSGTDKMERISKY